MTALTRPGLGRREALAGAIALAVVPPAAAAPVPAIRVVLATLSARASASYQAFERRLVELGYQPGRSLTFDYRQIDTLDDYAAGWRALNPGPRDVMLAAGTEASLKAALAVGDGPIVIVAVDYDPLVHGYVSSLAHPGRRVTGVFLRQVELAEKRLDFLHDAFPGVAAATMFYDRVSADQWAAAERAAARIGLRLTGVDLGTPPFDYDRALDSVPAEARGTLLAPTTGTLYVDSAGIAAFALRRRMVSVFGFREWADKGGLIAYGPSLLDMWRRAADYVDRIARGASPDDLPVEQPTRYELVINLATARKLGIELPPSLLARADDVIE